MSGAFFFDNMNGNDKEGVKINYYVSLKIKLLWLR